MVEMCGIAGVIDARASDPVKIAVQMAESMRHRGPDDGGSWGDGDAGIGLGFRRLSIRDLSPAGHQPMVSASGRYVVVFNGEIYSDMELRDALRARGIALRGHSDTEALVEAFAHFGVRSTL